MRRIWRTLLLTALFTVLLGTAALAADTTKSGMYDIYGPGAVLKPQTAAGSTATSSTETVNGASKTFYANAVKLMMRYTASANEECLVMVTNRATTSPAVSDIVYIDQVAAGSDGVAAFSLYPSSLASGTTYHVYVSTASGSGLTEVGTFSYYAPYMLGDVDGDKIVTVTDAFWVLDHIAGNRTLTGNQLLAANVITAGSSGIDTTDAFRILDKVAGNITDFGA